MAFSACQKSWFYSLFFCSLYVGVGRQTHTHTHTQLDMMDAPFFPLFFIIAECTMLKFKFYLPHPLYSSNPPFQLPHHLNSMASVDWLTPKFTQMSFIDCCTLLWLARVSPREDNAFTKLATVPPTSHTSLSSISPQHRKKTLARVTSIISIYMNRTQPSIKKIHTIFMASSHIRFSIWPESYLK